jgi:hypothetical protein
MYPKSFVDLFPAFPQRDEVFVAMSFHASLSLRYEAIIRPAIEGCGLKPLRVDKSQISDSILTDILKGVTQSLLIFADLTGPEKKAASPNVMYEVGLAHALRLPAEVILFRSDIGHPPFDLANVRLNKYDPEEDPDHAKQLVESAIRDARREIDSTERLIVQDIADQLSHNAAISLMAADQPWDVPLTVLEYSHDTHFHDDFQARIRALLDMRLIRCTFEDSPWVQELPWLKPLALVQITPLGRAVSAEVGKRTGQLRLARERVQQNVDRDLLSTASDGHFLFSFRQHSFHMPDITAAEKAALLEYVKLHAVGERVHKNSSQIDYLMHRWEREVFWPARRAQQQRPAT